MYLQVPSATDPCCCRIKSGIRRRLYGQAVQGIDGEGEDEGVERGNKMDLS